MFKQSQTVYHYGFKNTILSMDYETGLMVLLSEHGDIKQAVHYTQVSPN